MSEPAVDVSSALAGLRQRVESLEGTPLSPVEASIAAVVPAAQDFFRMDNPWMWAGVVGVALLIFGLWWFLGKNKGNSNRDDEDDEDNSEPTAPAWPQQTTPRQEYARQYGSIY